MSGFQHDETSVSCSCGWRADDAYERDNPKSPLWLDDLLDRAEATR